MSSGRVLVFVHVLSLVAPFMSSALMVRVSDAVEAVPAPPCSSGARAASVRMVALPATYGVA